MTTEQWLEWCRWTDLTEAERKIEQGYLTAKQVGEVLGKSHDTIIRWSKVGKLPAGKIIDGWTYWYRADIEQWIEDHPSKSPNRPPNRLGF